MRVFRYPGLIVMFGLAAVLFAASCEDQQTTINTTTPVPTSPVVVTVGIPVGSADLGPNAFGQRPLIVVVQTTVNWINNDTEVHTITADDGSFDSGQLAPGQQFSHQFGNPGTFGYHCTLHPTSTGVVQVNQVSPSPTPTTGASPAVFPIPTPTTTVSPLPVPPPATPVVTPAIPPALVTIEPGAVERGAQAYGVNPLVVSVGTKVTWINNDSMPHTSTSDTRLWDSGPIAPGAEWSAVFTTPGTFPYHCDLHGQTAMSGTIRVEQQ